MVIVDAFTLDGKRYFMPQSIDELPAERAMYFHLYYEEMRFKCDKEFLEGYNSAIKNLTKKIYDILQIKSDGTGISINEIIAKLSKIEKQCDMLDQRMKLNYSVSQILKVASVVIFDENEHPAKYDVAYNQKKIELWKKKSICQQLLEIPFLKLIAFTEDAKNNFQTYSEEMDSLMELDWKLIIENMSEEQLNLYKHHTKS